MPSPRPSRRGRTLRPAAGVAALALAGALAVAAPAGAAPRPSVTAKAPSAVARGTTATVKVTVRNRSARRLSGLSLTASQPTGTRVTVAGAKRGTRTRALKTLKGRGRTTVTVRVTPGAKAQASSKVRLTLRRRGRTQATASAAVALAGTNGAPAPAPATNPWAGRYFWRSSFNGTTTFIEGYYFGSGGFAYRGIPEGGLQDCSTTTAAGDGDGCVPYAYDPATGALAVNGVPAAAAGPHGLNVGDETLTEAVIPAPGSRWDLELSFINAYGLCPLSCTTVTVDLDLRSSGVFARGAAVSGTTPDANFGALPPDKHGTYSVEPGGRIVFAYADGKVVTETIAVLLNDAGQPDPAYGLLLDDSVFFGPNSEVR